MADSDLEKAQATAMHWYKQAQQVQARYDVLESNKLRRTPRRETKSEDGIYSLTKRLHGANIGRDLERNYSPARCILHQFRMNVVGALGKMQVNVEGGDDAAAWFNQVWAPDCDFREPNLHWSTFGQNSVAAVLREGDYLTVFDDDLIEDTGKLITWESDQIVKVSDDVLAQVLAAMKLPADTVQENGILRDKWGRVVGYLATGKRGFSIVDKYEDVTPWKASNALLPKNPWRLNQGRGVPTIITAASSLLDVYEMLARELQTAKRAAADYARVYREDAVGNWDDPGANPEYLPENDGKTAETVGAEGANSDNSEMRNYEALEAFTGGHVDYGVPGDTVDFANTDRPNVHMPEFVESVLCSAGAAFGMARAYALLRADTSYTSFRGDMIMTWEGAFYPMQKWHERAVADHVGRKALAWAQRKRVIDTLPVGWETKISWQWPRMPEVNQKDAEIAIAQSLKNGTTDYAELLGPDWQERLRNYAGQVDRIRELNLPLEVLELKRGRVTEGSDNEQD